MKTRLLPFLCWVSALALANPAESAAPPAFKLPSVGGWAMTPDNVTLIVAVPTKGELVYFDTLADKEGKHVEVDFQPTCLALQGKNLFAGAKGSSIVHMLDAASGKENRSFKLPGEPIFQLACHPGKGLVYASNGKQEIFSINPQSGKVEKTEARGMFLAVDPAKGDALYTGSIKPPEEEIVVRGGPDGKLVITFHQTGGRASMLKYGISSQGLKLLDGTDNAAIGAGGAMHLSPDGSSLAFIAGGGWTSTEDPKQRAGIAVFGSDDLKTMRGAVDVGAPQNLAFHPVLKLGVGLGNNVDLFFFNPKSLAVRKKVSLPRLPHSFWFNLLTFGGKGTKLIHLQGENLSFVPLELSDEERAALEQFYGKGGK
jgi:hypothetical protein